MIEKCECGCGKELTAINISDIEPTMTKECVMNQINKMELIPEDSEVWGVTDEDLTRLSTMIAPSPQEITIYLNLKNSTDRIPTHKYKI
jgi:hypothetical protein